MVEVGLECYVRKDFVGFSENASYGQGLEGVGETVAALEERAHSEQKEREGTDRQVCLTAAGQCVAGTVE